MKLAPRERLLLERTPIATPAEKKRVRRKMGKWLLLEFRREAGLPVLRLLAGPDGRAELTLRKMPCGTLSLRWADGTPEDDLTAGFRKALDRMEQRIRHMLALQALGGSAARRREVAGYLAGVGSPHQGRNSLRHHSLEVMWEVLGNSLTPSGMRQLDEEQARKLAQRLFRTHFRHRDAARLARLIDGRSIAAHSFAAANQEGMAELEEDRPQTLWLFARLALENGQVRQDRPPRRDSREISEMVRRNLGVWPGEQEAHMEAAALICRNTEQHGTAYRKMARRAARNFCRLMARVRMPQELVMRAADEIGIQAAWRMSQTDGEDDPETREIMERYRDSGQSAPGELAAALREAEIKRIRKEREQR